MCKLPIWCAHMPVSTHAQTDAKYILMHPCAQSHQGCFIHGHFCFNMGWRDMQLYQTLCQIACSSSRIHFRYSPSCTEVQTEWNECRAERIHVIQGWKRAVGRKGLFCLFSVLCCVGSWLLNWLHSLLSVLIWIVIVGLLRSLLFYFIFYLSFVALFITAVSWPPGRIQCLLTPLPGDQCFPFHRAVCLQPWLQPLCVAMASYFWVLLPRQTAQSVHLEFWPRWHLWAIGRGCKHTPQQYGKCCLCWGGFWLL